MMITMSKSDYEIILKHARENLPEEACGLVAGKKEGKDKFIEKVYCLTNIDHSNEHFSLDPKEQLAAVKDMRANGLVPLGNWHSHPESPGNTQEMKHDQKNICIESGSCAGIDTGTGFWKNSIYYQCFLRSYQRDV